jgi:hypothetical protein
VVFTQTELVRTIAEGFCVRVAFFASTSWECRMRLVRLVVAGVVLGAIGGYAAALLRPRTVHRRPGAGGLDVPPLPEQYDAAQGPELDVAIDVAEVRR